MTRPLGRALTPELVERFSQRDVAHWLGAGLPFVTIDAEGRPHPMLLSYGELRAYDATTVGLVILAGSRGARNLVERHTGTLLVIEPEATVYSEDARPRWTPARRRRRRLGAGGFPLGG